MRSYNFLRFFVLSISMIVCAGERPDDRLLHVNSIFVTGNNQAAEQVRRDLAAGKSCVRLAEKIDAADAVLDINAQGDSMGGHLGSLGGRTWIVSGTVTLRSGELIWSRSQRSSDSPLKSGAKSAGAILLSRFSKDCSCSSRKRLPQPAGRAEVK